MQLLTRKFTIDNYHKMAEVGILTPEDRVELIQGEIISMSPIGSKHAACVNRLTNLFPRQLGDKVIVSVQNSIKLDEYSSPQPDIVLLKPRADFYETQIPQPEDILLLIEVSDSTLKYDQEVKLPLYAASGIIEVWIVNLNNQTVEVYQNLQNQIYQTQNTLPRNQSISPVAFPDLTLRVTEIFG